MARGLGAISVLVIDDSHEMCVIVGTVLSAAGVGHVHYASNGRHALDIMHDHPVDVIFVDHEMPVMSGLEFVKAVRGLEGAERFMPIIMLTGHADLRHVGAARDTGVTEFLCKPVTAKAIIDRLNAVIMEPRPFMQSGDFFGPDRRRSRDREYDGEKRRRSDGG